MKDGHVELPQYIAANKDRLIARWKLLAVERLALNLEWSELVNSLPDFLDDVVATLESPKEHWPAIDSAQAHGRHRLRNGIDIGALTEEMALVTEALCELREEDGCTLTCRDVQRLTRVVGRGTAASVSAYAAMRDEEMSRQARQHFSFVAHELRTPLQTATMVVSLLRGGLGSRQERFRSRLERSLARLTELVDNSLVQVRLAGIPDMQLQSLPVGELVDAACEDIWDHAEARGLRLETEVEAFALEVDRKLMVSALTNLLKNAVKFTCDGGSVRIRVSKQDSRALFEVEDECGGMPEELPKRLFQPFVQAHADQSGFGLGLLIVKQAAEAHQGSVRVNNRPGAGCSFVIHVPLVQPDPTAGREEQPSDGDADA